jgi:beta-lactamase superfamily II metal-dependent hydrolase
MSLSFKVLKANHGDSIAVRLITGSRIINILIDGGPSKSFLNKSKAGDLKKFLIDIKKANQKIDLLILTHVDDDHVAGLLKAFSKKGFLEDITERVWFNSGRTIYKHFLDEESVANDLSLDVKGTLTSITQGEAFEKKIKNLGIWKEKVIKSGDFYEFSGARVDILSPSNESLKKLLYKWKIEKPKSFPTSSRGNDYNKTFSELLVNDDFREDNSKHNGSSIAFILSFEDKKLLLLGDAHPSVVIEGIKKLGYSTQSPLKVDYVKLSHHGSKANTNYDFLSLIECDNYIISTDGTRHNLPNKTTLARIAKKNPKSNFLFNYESLINKVFSSEELEGEFNVSKIEGYIQL